jgi:hypothetical protein
LHQRRKDQEPDADIQVDVAGDLLSAGRLVGTEDAGSTSITA